MIELVLSAFALVAVVVLAIWLLSIIGGWLQ